MKYKLHEVFEFIRNGANIKQGIEGGYPITRIETISDRYINRDKMGYAGIYDLSKYEDYLLKDGDILMSHINSEIHLGKSAIYQKKDPEEKIIHGMNLLCLRPNPKIIFPKYVFYYFNTHFFKMKLNKIIKKSVNQASFSVTDLKKIEIDIPNIDIQIKIANTLDKAQELIDKRNAQIEALDQLTQSVFLEMFGDPITNPKGWKLAICKDITSKIGSGATPKGGNASYKQQGISLIRSMNVYNNNFNYNDLAFIDEEQAEKLKNVIVNKDDILLNITGASVARSCIVPDDVLPARVNQHVSIIRVIKHLINPIFLSYTFTNEIYQKYLLRLSTSGGATREAITKKQIENLPIIIPPLDLQEQFAIKVTKIKEQKSIIQKSIGEIENLFNSLMQKAFKGELFNEEKVPNL
jgi:type I restriction enzyme, S subunit